MATVIPTGISLLLLAAHALRLGSIGAALFWLIAAVLAASPAAWKNLALAGLLGVGAWLWADIALPLVEQRMAFGLPWMRQAALPVIGTLLCLLALLMNLARARRRTSAAEVAPAAVFLLTIAGLGIARQMTPMDIILADRFLPGAGWPVIILLGLYGAWISGKLLDGRSSARWRRMLWTLFSLVFFFQLFLGLAGFERFLMTGNLHLPIPALIVAGPLYRGEGFFMIILFAVTVLLVGPAWCSYLCYFGAWDNAAANVQRRPARLPRLAKTARWIICVLVVAAAAILGRSGLEPLPVIALAASFGVAGIAVMLLYSRRKGVMLHCAAFCPIGLIANIFGKIHPGRIAISPECSKCNACARFCRYGALSPDDLALGRPGLSCSLCGDCLPGCPQGHLHYRFPGLSGAAARSGFIIAVTVLHAIFLGVARI